MKSFLKLFYLLIVAVIVFTGALMVAEGHRQKEEKEALKAKEAAEEAARLQAESRRPDPFDSFFGSGWDFLFDSMMDSMLGGGEESAL